MEKEKEDSFVYFNFMIKKSVKERLLKVAKHNDTNGSQIIRLLIREYLSKNETKLYDEIF